MGKSKFKCVCNCKICGKEVLKNKTQMKKSKSGNVFCSNICVGKYNGIKKNKGIKKTCTICKTVYKVKPSLAEKSVTCSVGCQKQWQSKFLVGERANNYKGRTIMKDCEWCGESYKTQMDRVEKGLTKFCSQKCKQEHWKTHILHNEEFKVNWFKGNEESRNGMSSRETKPEMLVREWLESNDIFFIQEKGFFRKYFADFFFPQRKMVIEVMGDYWHGNPAKYKQEELNDEQISRVEKDKIKKEDFERFGFVYIEIWESDIYNNLDEIMKGIFPSTTTRRTP